MIEAAPGDYRQIVVETLALVLDVDGVVSPVPGPTDWGDDLSAGAFFGPVMTSPELCRRLDRVGQHPGVIGLWLTSWHAQTRARMSLFPGRDWLHFDPDGFVAESDESGWWKADALLGWIDQQPAISRLVWVDDHLARPHDSAFDVLVDGVETRADRLTSIMAERGVRATLIAPSTAIGLTREHMSRIEQVVLDEFGPDGR